MTSLRSLQVFSQHCMVPSQFLKASNELPPILAPAPANFHSGGPVFLAPDADADG
jgi:hypothetical protein